MYTNQNLLALKGFLHLSALLSTFGLHMYEGTTTHTNRHDVSVCLSNSRLHTLLLSSPAAGCRQLMLLWQRGSLEMNFLPLWSSYLTLTWFNVMGLIWCQLGIFRLRLIQYAVFPTCVVDGAYSCWRSSSLAALAFSPLITHIQLAGRTTLVLATCVTCVSVDIPYVQTSMTFLAVRDRIISTL